MTVYNIVDTSGTISPVDQGQEIPAGGVVIGETSDANYLAMLVPGVAIISKFAFLQRFTETELVAIELAKIHDSSSSQSQQQFAAMLRLHQLKLDASKYVDLMHSETVSGLNGLEAAGLLATGRASAILNAPVQPEEAP